jgi:predicted RNA binding protein YcfA (HicA-like mRNA interferase family)
MGRKDRILEAIEENPGGWRYEQVASILRSYGFRERTGRGSHRAFSHPKGGTVALVQKGHGSLKGYQVIQATQAIRMSMEDT